MINFILNGDKNGIADFPWLLPNNDNGKKLFTFKPIESIDLFNRFKCLTFFDEKQIPVSKNKVNLRDIEFHVYFSKSWFPFDSTIGISIAIHSPNVIPGRDSFVNLLGKGSLYNIFYSKLEDIRLNNYDNCIDRGDIENDNDTRTYCLDKCFMDSLSSECFALFARNRQHSLRRYQLPSSLNNCYNLTNYEDDVLQCYIKCKEDCYQAHYFVKVEIKQKPDGISTVNDAFRIVLQSNSRPNKLIEHFAELTFLALICDFGGLIGMYLGISLQSVTCDIWEMAKKMCVNSKCVQIINNKYNNLNQRNLSINIYNIAQKHLYDFRRQQQAFI